MTFTEKAAHHTVKTKQEICGIKISYPVISGAVASEDINRFLDKCADEFVSYCKSHPCDQKIFSLCGNITYFDDDICSIFFEKTERTGRIIVSYKPFSATFSLKSGCTLPLTKARVGLTDKYKHVRNQAQKSGIKISFGEFSRKYYLTSNGAVIYKSVFSSNTGAKSPSECIRKFVID